MAKIVTRIDDKPPLYFGVPEEWAKYALHHMTAHRLDLLGHILGQIQISTAAARRQGDRPRNTELKLPISWLMRMCVRREQGVVRDLHKLTRVEIAGFAAPIEYWAPLHGQTIKIVVRSEFACPDRFMRIPLPVPVDHKLSCQLYLHTCRQVQYAGQRARSFEFNGDIDRDSEALVNVHLQRLQRHREYLQKRCRISMPSSISCRVRLSRPTTVYPHF